MEPHPEVTLEAIRRIVREELALAAKGLRESAASLVSERVIRGAEPRAVVINAIWSYYRQARSELGIKGARKVPPPEAVQMIKERLVSYTEADLRIAIDQLFSSDWHREKREYGFEMVFGADRRVDRLLGKEESPDEVVRQISEALESSERAVDEAKGKLEDE